MVLILRLSSESIALVAGVDWLFNPFRSSLNEETQTNISNRRQ